MNKLKLKKIDKRNSGYGEFRFCTEFTKSDFEKFINIRNWCWDQWGASCELNFWYQNKDINPAWCWLVDDWRTRIYFRSEAEAQWFTLKWR